MAGQSYSRDIQPILDRRCVVCHACYDAPCQLKATSSQGLARGASKEPVYDASRLLAADPSRLFVDADKPSEWRTRGFFPVLNERAPTPEANRTAGLMHRLLMLKSQHPMPSDSDAAGERARATASARRQVRGRRRHRRLRARRAAGGHALRPARTHATEHRTLTRWLEQGARYEGPPPLPAATAQRDRALGTLLQRRLARRSSCSRRYIYEHCSSPISTSTTRPSAASSSWCARRRRRARR